MMQRIAGLTLVVVIAACGGSSDDSADAATAGADAAVVDAPPAAADATVADAEPGSSDAEVADADPSACHSFGFGSAAVSLEQVGSLPAMTGGTIELGIYDAVQFQVITSTLTGSYRATWEFESGGVLQIYEQLALNGNTPPTPTPRTLSWSTSSTTLDRQQTCGGSDSFSNEYTVRTVGPDTFLDVRQSTIMFTFKKRP